MSIRKNHFHSGSNNEKRILVRDDKNNVYAVTVKPDKNGRIAVPIEGKSSQAALARGVKTQFCQHRTEREQATVYKKLASRENLELLKAANRLKSASNDDNRYKWLLKDD